MQFSTIIALLVSVTAVHSAAVAEPDTRAVIKLLKRQGQGITPEQCQASNLIHCKNPVSTDSFHVQLLMTSGSG
ncbi:hypothetical protein CTA2_9343 [Colletotrichum tanaceti]|uniref:Uncharacterized protein n=1 Tax=Colletotrichum tanaceti TaxID=1306861 RepID=A0A4U6XH40_9PEZI|nr:hypothetical protein CTA2_9343 [Colletotrichum tanaceti]TKW55228.1 hypothetical protein CTA1_9416 [Colletotrichum tanaceti]